MDNRRLHSSIFIPLCLVLLLVGCTGPSKAEKKSIDSHYRHHAYLVEDYIKSREGVGSPEQIIEKIALAKTEQADLVAKAKKVDDFEHLAKHSDILFAAFNHISELESAFAQQFHAKRQLIKQDYADKAGLIESQDQITELLSDVSALEQKLKQSHLAFKGIMNQYELSEEQSAKMWQYLQQLSVKLVKNSYFLLYDARKELFEIREKNRYMAKHFGEYKLDDQGEPQFDSKYSKKSYLENMDKIQVLAADMSKAKTRR